MVVIQDVRGRYTSEGEWYTFKHETEDGYDTVEWAAALPIRTAKWACLAVRMWARRRCWQPSVIRHIWPGSARW